MTRSSLSIITEFLRSSDAQQRRNALTALAALPSTEGCPILAETALTDADRSMRVKAQTEIERLDRDRAMRVAAYISERFSSYELAAEAYALLGRLRNRAIPFPLPRLGWLKRLMLAKAVADQVTPIRDFNFRLRFLVPSLVVCAMGLVLVGALAFLQVGFGRDDNVIMISVLTFGTTVGVLVSQKVSDLDRQLDRTAAVLLEMSRAFIFAGVAGLVGFVLLTLISRGEIPGDAVLKFFLKACVLSVVVRLGTLAGQGAFGRRILVSEYVSGASLGILFLTLTPLFLGGPDSDYAGMSWAILVPVSLALSYVFTKMDVSSIASAPFLGRAGVLVTLLAGVTVVAALVIVLLPEKVFHLANTGSSQEIRFTSGNDDLTLSVFGTTLFRFQIQDPGYFQARIAASDFGLDLLTADGRNLASDREFPSIKKSLEPGRYELRVLGAFTSLGMADTLRTIANRIRARVLRREPRSAPAELNISLRNYDFESGRFPNLR